MFFAKTVCCFVGKTDPIIDERVHITAKINITFKVIILKVYLVSSRHVTLWTKVWRDIFLPFPDSICKKKNNFDAKDSYWAMCQRDIGYHQHFPRVEPDYRYVHSPG